MSSDKFKDFLEFQARRSPLRVSKDYVSWEDKTGSDTSRRYSDFLESVYFGKELQNTVVMERGVAAMLQHRLQELERENERLRGHMRILKFIVFGTTPAAIAAILWALLTAAH